MNILFLGGDKRYSIMMRNLEHKYNIYQVGFKNTNTNIHDVCLENLDLSVFDVILFPISGINDNYEIKTENRYADITYSYIQKTKRKCKNFYWA